MSLAITYSRTITGIQAPLVIVEAHLSHGLPRFSIVGLPETIIKESKDRIRSAILNSHFDFPDYRITVNLAPADLPKMGSCFDLPIALAILAASDQIPSAKLCDYEFVGELALSGSTRSVPGILPLALALRIEEESKQKNNADWRRLVLPSANANEAARVTGVTLFPTDHLLDICRHLKDDTPLQSYQAPPTLTEKAKTTAAEKLIDLADVVGQAQAKRALTIAAAGQHSVLLSGPPGCGKSMLAKRLISILPEMTEIEALEVAAIRSIANKGFNNEGLKTDNWLVRPYRAPHHTISSAALVGGGNPPRPGEISYAHHGLLFLDELPEFNRQTLETLREPLEQGKITIARVGHSVEFPAQFQLIAAMNLCPCGHYGDTVNKCRCSPQRVQQYLHRLSGPLLERFDLHVAVSPIDLSSFTESTKSDMTSTRIKKLVLKAHQRQLKYSNSKRFYTLSTKNKHYLASSIKQLRLSARTYQCTLRVARTIANLRAAKAIEKADLMEALSYQIPVIHPHNRPHIH